MMMGLVLGLLLLVMPVDAAQAAGESKGASATRPIDLNTATAEELTTVPGIGPATATRIVQFREQHGDFKRVEDLLKVKGIGEKSLQKLIPYLKVSKSRSK